MWEFLIWMIIGLVVVLCDMVIRKQDYEDIDTLFDLVLVLLFFSVMWPVIFLINCHDFLTKKRKFWFNK